jgi:Sulfotransferase family
MVVEPVQIHDLAEPEFTGEVEEIRTFMDLMAADTPLDAGVLHQKAMDETGLDDFGADDYRERFDLFLTALSEIDGLHGPGILSFHMQLLQVLKNRLLMEQLLKDHPQIRDIELVPPVVIAGLPRTGTTHLHNLLAAGPTFRVLRYWESIEPFPMAAEIGVEPDPRLARTDLAVDFMNQAMPHFKLMHEMTTEHVHEEIQLLFNDVSSMLMETLGHVPAWRDHYLAHDQTAHYEHLKLQLQLMQHLRGGRRWLLKSPQHLEQLPVLESVFPGVTVVVTHRDPVPVTLSMLLMLCYTARMHRATVNCDEIVDYWVDRLDLMLRSLVRDRDAIPAERSLDIRFDDFMADDLAVTAQVYELAGEPLTDEARGAMADYLAGHQRGRLGTVATSPQMFGLSEVGLRDRFAPYVERFLG